MASNRTDLYITDEASLPPQLDDTCFSGGGHGTSHSRDGKEKRRGTQAIGVYWGGKFVSQSGHKTLSPPLPPPGVDGPSVSPRVCLLIHRHPACLMEFRTHRPHWAVVSSVPACYPSSLDPNFLLKRGSTHRVSDPCFLSSPGSRVQGHT
ncbi:hypothetical protein CGRA01v4_09761 [Colletotrichum graminicola]|nr:hypothetical protein CGRA01v4_09761 [Colletotrichum graminicola]